MKFKSTDTPIPTERRADINEKILNILQQSELPKGITAEDIFNGYTGVGGLHGLDRSAFPNYFEYAKGKKEIEQGQFFTEASTVEFICKHLPVGLDDNIADLSCGAGAFFNYFNEEQCYGCDIDKNAIKVAKFLYPEANIQCVDIRYYNPGIHFDFVVGNPPFNLRFDVGDQEILSQWYYCIKASELLKPGGILICIVPDSFLKDTFFTKSMIQDMDSRFSFLFQYTLPADAFKNMGVAKFNTKVICFQAHAESIQIRPYKNVYIQPEESIAILKSAGEQRKELRVKLHRENLSKFGSDFIYKSKKYLYEIKMQPVLKKHLIKALAKMNQFYTQKQPQDMSHIEWDKVRLTENKVLAYLRGIVLSQADRPVDMYKLVKYNYGIKYKAYSRTAALRLKKEKENRNLNFMTVIAAASNGYDFNWEHNQFKKLYLRKKAQFENQRQEFKTMARNEEIDQFLSKFKFRKADGSLNHFNEFQKQDLGLMLQKNYGILNWQQGSGKTPAAAAWAKYKPNRNTFIIGPALAIELTWEKFMSLHKRPFVIVRSMKDIDSIRPGMFVLISLDYLVKYKRQVMKYVKMQSQKVNVIFDESDEITNANAKRTYATLACFRRVKRKLLATGTTTRNNITELFSQLELLYNNSYNLYNECQFYYLEDKETDSMKRMNNPYWQNAFPARGGAVWFKRCFNPAQSTVFGIQKHNQNIYNEKSLRKILEYTIITRKFKDIAGDKYKIVTKTVEQNDAEKEVYRIIIEELNQIIPEFYVSTGNSRKDAGLRLLRQMQLLIKATSMPQKFNNYTGNELPAKSLMIFDEVEKHQDKIAIGCTSIEAVEFYHAELLKRFPMRPIFKVIGDVTFKNREKIRNEFESTFNGILIATQQSLKSSVNIPSCSKVIIESKQWNIPKIEQFFFRFIRYDSTDHTEVVFINYKNTIDMNLMALLMAKEKLNDYIKTLEFKDDSDVFNEYDVDLDILNSIITKEKDDDGKTIINWGQSELVN